MAGVVKSSAISSASLQVLSIVVWSIAGIINSSSASYFIASIVNSSVSLQLPPSASSGSYRINRTKSPDWLHKKP